MEKPNGEPEQIFLKDLEKDYYRLQFLVDTENENLKKEMEISLKAGNLVDKLYDAILKQYINPDRPMPEHYGEKKVKVFGGWLYEVTQIKALTSIIGEQGSIKRKTQGSQISEPCVLLLFTVFLKILRLFKDFLVHIINRNRGIVKFVKQEYEINL